MSLIPLKYPTLNFLLMTTFILILSWEKYGRWAYGVLHVHRYQTHIKILTPRNDYTLVHSLTTAGRKE